MATESPGVLILRDRLKTSLGPAGLAYGLGLSVLAGVVVLHRTKGIPIGDLTRDPANSQSFPFYVGSVSHLGILLWCATATVCAGAALVLRASRDGAVPWAFFLSAAALSSLLMLDDLLLFHEQFFPFYLGIPEGVTYGAYATCVFGFLLVFRTTILQTAFPVLLSAGALLALGMFADTMTNAMADTSQKFLVEDGFKLLGICGWFSYFGHTAYQAINELMRPTE